MEARSITAIEVPDHARTQVLRWPGQRVLALRTDEVLHARVIVDPASGQGAEMDFPAPWPRFKSGGDGVSADLTYAVFVGPHSVRVVGSDGKPRWEFFHQCRTVFGRTFIPNEETECPCTRTTDMAETGSCHVTADGRLIWAHVTTPTALDAAGTPQGEAWLLLDASDGSIVHRIDLPDLYATHSRHIPHPDGRGVALCLGSDPDDITIIWGSWDGREANTRRGETEPGIILCDISPAGGEYVTLTPSTDTLTRYRLADDSPIIEVEYEALTTHPDADDPDDLPVWDQMCGYIDDATIIASTSDLDDQWGRHRHWALHSEDSSVPTEIAYPIPVTGAPIALGDGTWIARSDAGPNRIHLWARTTQ